jgi:hypothetical protein
MKGISITHSNLLVQMLLYVKPLAINRHIHMALTGQTTGKLDEYLPQCIWREHGNVAQSYRERKTW